MLLILSGFSISTLTGNNSIINMAGKAKENTKIAEEKEIIEKATIQAMGKNKYGNIKENELENELNEIVGIGKIKVVLDNEIVSSENSEVDISDYVFEDDDSNIIVEFINTNHKYLVNTDGTVSEKISSDTEANTDWEKINYEIRTDENENQYYAVTGLKDGVSKTSITIVNIAKTYRGIPVKIIENNAFYSCENVLKATIPNTITTIGEGAFRSCKSLKEIVIPDSVTNLICNGTWGVFSECTNLENVILGKNITNFGNYMFDGCVNIKHIKIPSNIPKFGECTFKGCTQLTKAGIGVTEGIELEDGITKIPDGLFYGSNLEEIIIPNTVTTIGKAAFNECRKLTEITIPNGVTTIGEGAFRCCSGLTEIEIPDSVTEIVTAGNWGSFRSCTKLENVTLGKNITKIGNNIFADCTSLKHINIPRSINSFGYNVFYGCTQLTKAGVGVTEGIELESGITKIPNGIFQGSDLEEIIIPETVTSIGNYAFVRCTKLPEIIIPNSVTTIGAEVFRNCSSLTEIVIPDSVTKIVSGASYGTFTSCTNLRIITLSKEIKTIGRHACEGCTNLETIIYKGASHTTEVSLKAAGITSIDSTSFTGTKITKE